MASRQATRKTRGNKRRVPELEGLTLNRTGEYVKVDDALVERLQKRRDTGEVDEAVERPNPFENYPNFIEIAKSDPLTQHDLSLYSEQMSNDPLSCKMAEMIGNVPVDWLALKRSHMMKNDWEYNVKLPVNARVTDQQHSGRCWMFAALGALRLDLIRKFNLDTRFELSQAYLFFYDKLERSNVFLETVWSLRDSDLNSREWLSTVQPNNHMMSDGGFYNYFSNLVQKYGLVPKNVYDEGLNSGYTDGMNTILITLLNDMALKVNRSSWSREEFLEQKQEWMSLIYSIIVKFLGQPPTVETKFDWNYRDAEGNSHTLPNLNPIKFFQTVVGARLDTKVLIINDPRHPETYCMSSFMPHSLNTTDGTPASMINLPMSEFKKAICESLKCEEAVWFATDIGHAFIPENNTADPDCFDYNSVLGTDLKFSKAEMLDARISSPNHAMLFIGVDVEEDREGNVTRYKKWRVENSWGMMNLLEDDPDNGYCRFSDSYMDQYVTEAVVDIKFLSPEVLQQVMENTRSGKSYTYDPYDVFGTVAMRSPCKHCSKKN